MQKSRPIKRLKNTIRIVDYLPLSIKETFRFYNKKWHKSYNKTKVVEYI